MKKAGAKDFKILILQEEPPPTRGGGVGRERELGEKESL